MSGGGYRKIWGAELPAAGEYWRLGGEALSRRMLGVKPQARSGAKRVWGQAPIAGRFLQFFNKNNAFLCIFRPK